MDAMPTQQAEAVQPEQPIQDGAVTLAKAPDGTFTCNGNPAQTIDEVLNMARELLVGDDGGMSVEQAFRGGFKGSEVGPPAGGMGY